MRPVWRLAENFEHYPRSPHQLRTRFGGNGYLSFTRAQPEAAGILLGAHLDDCGPALHHQSPDPGLAALRRNSRGRGPWSAHRQFFCFQLDRIWRRHFCLRTAMRAIAAGQCLPFRRHRADYRRAHLPYTLTLDRRCAPLRGSLAGNRGGLTGDITMASAGQRPEQVMAAFSLSCKIHLRIQVALASQRRRPNDRRPL